MNKLRKYAFNVLRVAHSACRWAHRKPIPYWAKGIVFRVGCVLFTLGMAVGCASMSAPQMSAEQLKAAATDKNFSAICLTFTGVGGSGKSVVVNVDQRVVINGSISVSPDCVVTMSNMATVKPEPAAK